MKNYSAPKLLRMIARGEHMPYCPHKAIKLSECKCWVHEVDQWEERMKRNSTNRVRKAKPAKVHYDRVKCSVRNRSRVEANFSLVTCAQCIEAATKPAKPAKRGKAHLSLVLGVP